MQTVIGNTTNKDYSKMLHFNLIKMFLVTPRDITMTTQMFGNDISSTRRKTACKKSEETITDYVMLPMHLWYINMDLVLNVYVIFVGGIGFFVT